MPVALPRLIAWLREHPELLTLVLDDVHHLQSPEALDVLAALCDNAPPASALLLGGRTRPALPLARLRAGGRLLEIDASDLAMTPAEGTAMLRATGTHVDEAEALLFVQRTEGWPAAIYLAGLLLRDGEAHWPEGAIGPDDPHLIEYVREEVLAHAGTADAAFLTRSSILDDLRPEICDAVLERSDSADRLRALVDANLLVTPGDVHGDDVPRPRAVPRAAAGGLAARAPTRSARCTGAPPRSTVSAGTRSARSATRSPRGTTATPPTSSGRSGRR